MNYSAVFFLSIILFILAVDRLFMPKHAKKAWQLMALAYFFAIIFILIPESLTTFAKAIGIGRGVDVIIYCLSFLLVREVFINRSRQSVSERQITILARQFAISNAKVFGRISD